MAETGQQQRLRVTTVGERCQQQLADEPDEEARAGDEAEAGVAEAVLVLQVAEQREDDAVGDADAGGGDEQWVPAGDAAGGHAEPGRDLGADSHHLRLVGQLHGAQHVALAAGVQLGEAPAAGCVALAVADRVQRVDVEPGRVGLGVPQRDQAATELGFVDQVGAVQQQLDGGDGDGLHLRRR